MKKMKRFLCLLPFLLLFSTVKAQIPEGYYDSAEGLSGYTLKTVLKNIINNHTVHTYGSLWDFFDVLDEDIYYENDGTLLDAYSENPTGPDPYNYNLGPEDRCGNYNQEADCWNREHVFPQGFFNELLPMKTDLHHILPVDGFVNNRRGNAPFGKVGNASWTSQNGTKVGTCNTPGHTGTCFEPLDEFKGDIARIFLYFATRYEDEVTSSSWKDPNIDNNNPLNGTNDQVYEDWYVDVLLDWHEQDPVSQKEIDRNNGIYEIQHNRNPFIDHPEWAEAIWRANMSVSDLDRLTQVDIYPNPAKDVLKIKSEKSIQSLSVYSLSGQNLVEKSIGDLSEINVSTLPKGIYLLKMIIDGKVVVEKFLKE